jgi:hypothetical protein
MSFSFGLIDVSPGLPHYHVIASKHTHGWRKETARLVEAKSRRTYETTKVVHAACDFLGYPDHT